VEKGENIDAGCVAEKIGKTNRKNIKIEFRKLPLDHSISTPRHIQTHGEGERESS
jgi:hypothetical protein